MKKLSFAICLMALLAGCQLNSLEGEYKDVEVKLKSKQSNASSGKFFPPGQAKKGNC